MHLVSRAWFWNSVIAGGILLILLDLALTAIAGRVDVRWVKKGARIVRILVLSIAFVGGLLYVFPPIPPGAFLLGILAGTLWGICILPSMTMLARLLCSALPGARHVSAHRLKLAIAIVLGAAAGITGALSVSLSVWPGLVVVPGIVVIATPPKHDQALAYTSASYLLFAPIWLILALVLGQLFTAWHVALMSGLITSGILVQYGLDYLGSRGSGNGALAQVR